MNYEYMGTYILTHEPKETIIEVLDEFYGMRQISEMGAAA